MPPNNLPAHLANLINYIWAAVLCAASGILGLLVIIAARRIFFHPLSRIPGPKLAAVSNAWYAYHVKHGRTAELGRKLHRNYGPAVRVGPNEVWFNSREAFDIIYSTGIRGFEKSEFYMATSLSKPQVNWRLQPTFEDNLDLLSEFDMQRYRLQRRLIGRVYRTDNLVRHEAAINKRLDQVVAKLKTLEGTKLDLKEWMHIIAVECLGASVLSRSPTMLQDGSDHGTSEQSYLGWRRKSVYGLFPMMARLDMKHRSLARIFGKLWGITFQTPKGFKPFFIDVGKRVNRRIKAATGSKNTPKNSQDLLDDLIQLHKDKPEFTELYLKKMAVTNFGAGHETLASTLTAVLSMFGTHPDIQEQSRQEIETHRAETQATPPSFSAAAANLPFTHAVIRESMRLYPVIAMSLPRRLPNSPLHIHGYTIPSGTTVGCNPVALQRNEDICGPHGDSFQPTRWLNDDSSDDDCSLRTRTLERYNLNWGGGSRTCPGRYLAELIVLKVVIRLVEEFEVTANVPPDAGRPSYFLSMLTGVRARLLPRHCLPRTQAGGEGDKSARRRRTGLREDTGFESSVSTCNGG